jgi:hypothetical protein
MYVPFETLPDHARVWIYQANRPFTNHDLDVLNAALKTFTNQWSVHGHPIETSFSIRYNQFVILAANDQVSGCSIDSSVRAMKEVGAQLEIDFFDRTQVAFLKDNGVETYVLSKLKVAFENNGWNAETMTFNNQLVSIKELSDSWIIPAKTSWLKRYLPQPF